jgi:hypothetical protein
MRTYLLLFLAGTLLKPCLLVAQGTSFTYQGRFNTDGTPYTGSAEFQFTLWDAASNGGQIAATTPASVIIGVTNGLFDTSLDFGTAAFPGADRWLQIDARTTIGSFTTLMPRQKVTPTPYAMRAGSVQTNGLPGGVYGNAVTFNNPANNINGTLTGNGAGLTSLNASQLTSGTVPDARLSANLARLNANQTFSGGNTFSGVNTFNHPGSSFAGNGAGLTSLNASQLTSGTVPDARVAANVARTNQVWLLGGNVGTAAGTQFLGTTDDEPLELKVNGQRGLRIEPNTNGAPNIIGGSANNGADAGVVGAFIGGGGATNFSFGGISHTNRIASSFGTIGGGFDNLIHTNARGATIGGGQDNSIQSGPNSTIGGGDENVIQSGSTATIAGGNRNTITNGFWSFIGGGFLNEIHDGSRGVIAGGIFNNILSQDGGTIGGGVLNQVGGTNIAGSSSGTGTNAYNTIVGGILNWIAAGSSHGFIGGGRSNLISNGANFAVVPGGQNNRAAGDYSFAAGRLAKADHDGAFVWADAQNADFHSTDTNQFLIRASGGVGIGTNNPAHALHVNGTARVDGHTTIGALFALSRVIVVPAAGSTLTPTSSYVVLNPTGPVILNATTAIANGSTIGDILILEGTDDVQSVTISNNANTSLAAATRTLGNDDTLMLLWNGGTWLEISFSNN